LDLVTQVLVAGIEVAPGHQGPPQLTGPGTAPDLDDNALPAVKDHVLAVQLGVRDPLLGQLRPGPAVPQWHDRAGRRGPGQAGDDQAAWCGLPACRADLLP